MKNQQKIQELFLHNFSGFALLREKYYYFVQADAANQGMAGATWKAMASTTTADAIDNVGTISSPIVNAFNSSSVAVDSADLWDLDWNGTNNISTIAGTNANVWFGTTTGGTSFLNGELGAGDGGARIEWSGWGSWDGVYREEPTSSEFALVGISEELTVIPETSAFALLGIGAGMALIRRRRK